VAIHHGALQTAFRKEVERLLRDGILKVTISSPTLAQGLNLSATTVIMHALFRNRERIETSEFRSAWRGALWALGTPSGSTSTGAYLSGGSDLARFVGTETALRTGTLINMNTRRHRQGAGQVRGRFIARWAGPVRFTTIMEKRR
jgi:hypothetical protein